MVNRLDPPTRLSGRELEIWRILVGQIQSTGLQPGDVLGEPNQIEVVVNPDGTITISIADPLIIGNLSVTAGLKLKIQRNISNTIIDSTAYQWNGDTTFGSFIYSLPVGIQDTQYKIVNTGTGGYTLTVLPNGTDNLLGKNSSFTLRDGESLIISYDEIDGWF